MLYFTNDYSEGCHPEVLRHLTETNLEPLTGYCEDPYCVSAAEKIRTACNTPNADIFFMMGGTQTNKTAISVMLGYNAGVIAPYTGHINTHEAGAVELTGHKVIPLPAQQGKLCAKDLDEYMNGFLADPNNVQMVCPAMVYISYPTEYGALYSREELYAISDACKKHDLLLYMDGARLGYGLASPQCDITLSGIASICDAFYIGGTKIGALCGEALVFPRGNAPKRFPTIMKQHGALLAKGRLLGVQFDALFTDDLYLKISKTAVEQTVRLYQAFCQNGYRVLFKPQTNQIFTILDNATEKELAKHVKFRFWERYDANHIVARFVTSWATAPQQVDELAGILSRLSVSHI